MREDDENMNGKSEEMTPEQRRRQMDFILNQQAQFAVNQQQSDGRISRLERVMKLVVRAGLRERKETREKINALIASQVRITETQAQMQAQMTESAARMNDALTRMADAQARSDARLDALIDIVRNERNGKA